ncbi:MAG: FAD:protein FMN transferase [Bacilli bacterium]|nr:FAD:protein FMN transferase [Bacilli bacterium]
MKKLWKMYYGPIVSVLLIVFFAFYLIIDSQKIREYHKTYHYMDSYINIKIYTKSPSKARKTFKELAKIYAKYEILTSQRKSPSLKNIYYIKNNSSKDASIKIEEDLYSMIAFGKSLYTESKGLLDVGAAAIERLYLDGRTKTDMEKAKSDIDEIALLNNNNIKNQKADITLTSFRKGTANEAVKAYLLKNGISKYIINAGGNIIVGKHYGDSFYKIGLEDPTEKGNYYKMLEEKEESIVTKTVNDSIISPKTYEAPTYHKAVTVIANDAGYADALAQILYMQSLEEGQQYLEQKQSAKAGKYIKVIWYTSDKKVVEKEYQISQSS